ncbi:MAG: cytochrome P450 [Rhizobiaceae bacterium]|nr:cytochrome P450 [Rhizobiaceae bacterium]MCV0408822.1 cytochrome P450 [Rhizobiaceae bacterium]
MTSALPAWLDLDPAARRLRLSPREPAFVQDPYAAYAALHADAPFVYWEDLGLWCVAGFDAVNRILRDRRFGRERPGGYLSAVAASGDRTALADFDRVEAGSMLELEPPAHTRLRTLVNRAFVSRQVERLHPVIENLAHELIDRFGEAGETDLISSFATPLPATVIAGMMGLPVETGPQLVAWSNDMVRMYQPSPGPDAMTRANRSARDFAAFIRDHADRRRREPSDDLLGVLVSAEAGGDRLSEDELVSSAILLLNAGHEATVHQIGNAVVALLAHGDDPRRFFASDTQTAATVEECLRFDAPLHLFTRYAYEDAEIAPDITLAKGEQVGLLLGAANRDPAAFHEPHRFDPARSDGRHVSFGAGIHFCIGAPLARLELQVALSVLFRRLPELRLAEPPRWRDSWHFHGLERLVVEW